MESIVPKYYQIWSRIVGRVGFGVTHCPALTLLLLLRRLLARPVLLLPSSNTVHGRPLVLTDRQTNKHPGMTIRFTIRDTIIWMSLMKNVLTKASCSDLVRYGYAILNKWDRWLLDSVSVYAYYIDIGHCANNMWLIIHATKPPGMQASIFGACPKPG